MLAAASSHQPTVNPKALGWTLGIHALLLLIFIFWRYQLPANPAPLEEMGMEVNIGTSADGFGDAQPLELGDPAPPDISSFAAQAASSQMEAGFEADGDEVVHATPVASRDRRQENRQQQVNRKPSAATATRTNATESRPQQPKHVFAGFNGTGGNKASQQMAGGSEGNTQGAGDRGVPGGTPGASNYEGTPGRGGGAGLSWSVGDRRVVDFPSKEAEFREGGKVVMRVTVNQEGEIIRSSIKSTSSGALTAIAQQKLKKVRFNKNHNAPPEQFGEVVFDFKARQ